MLIIAIRGGRYNLHCQNQDTQDLSFTNPSFETLKRYFGAGKSNPDAKPPNRGDVHTISEGSLDSELITQMAQIVA